MTSGRRLGLALVGMVLAAAGLWVASELVWLRVEYLSALRGPVSVDVTGTDLAPTLLGVAALAAAGIAATVATAGFPRRLVGALLVLAGAGALWLAGQPYLGAGPPAGLPGIPAGAELTGTRSVTAAPALAVLSALLLVAAGLVVFRGARELPRLGARFDAPGSARKSERPPRDRDRAWWDALDAGEDPTRTSPGPDPRPDH